MSAVITRSSLLRCSLLRGSQLSGSASGFRLRSFFRLKGTQRSDQLVGKQVVMRVGGPCIRLTAIACRADDFPTIRAGIRAGYLRIQIRRYRGIQIAMYCIRFVH